ncbi:hypothetical protein B0T22DRAFT_119519 [Podospora appendiculata]|uniref:Uncharacterized protein n=1 Tax=Podospora appendiculata TaxID=314037 RepID=A0AAE1C6V4_9PEZI|nr:hypothetical protein B0T22DRAFT_119519 [Podospora appendiculata]
MVVRSAVAIFAARSGHSCVAAIDPVCQNKGPISLMNQGLVVWGVGLRTCSNGCVCYCRVRLQFLRTRDVSNCSGAAEKDGRPNCRADKRREECNGGTRSDNKKQKTKATRSRGPRERTFR